MSHFKRRPSRYRRLLVCVVAVLAIGGPAAVEAGNGEPVAAEGLHRTGTCTTDFAISCDDRAQDNVVSCHMRGPRGDEGLALNACVDGRVATGAARAEILEQAVTVKATDFGEFVCGKERDALGNLVDFCVVCDTVKPAPTSGKKPSVPVGGSRCVKIINNQQTSAAGACGAYSVSNDTSGICLNRTQELEATFSDPNLGFTIGIDASDAGEPGAKELVLCGRSWQCINNRSLPLAVEAEGVQQQQGHALINTPCCIKLSSGGYYCSSKITTCR